MTALRVDYPVDNIARITFDMPGSKANTLGLAVLGDWENVLAELEKHSNLQGVILCSGKPGMFIAGADLKELGSPQANSQNAGQLVQRGLNILARLEKLPCPTVALIDGACMGGGTEVALAFDYRLAGSSPKVDIGLPEVKVGLIPGWGGTQRLARVIGPSLAAELICAGETVKSPRARTLGIVFDTVPSDKLLEEGLRVLEMARTSGDWKSVRQKKQRPVGLSEEQLTFAYAAARGMILAKTKGQLPAPLAALDAIFKGCNLPLEDGLRVETAGFAPLLGSTISRNLISVFFLTQRLQKDTGVADQALQPAKVERVAVLGAGIMGSGIAGAHIRRGVPTLMCDVDQPALERGKAANLKILQGRVQAGRGTQQEIVDALGNLSTAPIHNMTLLGDRDVVIEAVVENEAVKTKLYRDLAPHLAKHAILASNTSTISITRMAQAAPNPAQFAGMHFFNPVDRMQLVEVIRGEQTSDATVVTLVALAKRIGKSPIVIKDCPGFLVNRILFPYINESLLLLEEGAEPRAIDKAATAFGMPMGPITLNDVVGLDTALYAGNVVNTAFADRAKSSKILEDLVKAGRLGQKSGAGFYSYAKGSRGVDDPALATFFEKHRTGPKKFEQEELTDRLFLPMLVEASLLLSEGIVRDAGDVDLGLILGIGFPPQTGGLLRWADTIGLDKILQKMAKYEPLGARFRPTEQMGKLASSGKGFYA